MKVKNVLGIDVGGSAIKGAVVDIKTGELVSERLRIETPFAATPENVVQVIQQIVGKCNWTGPVGIGFPAVVQNGVAKTAANINKKFIGLNIEEFVSKTIKCPVKVVNDADAAGIAEMKIGAGIENKGVVILITVGTGLGTVIFTKGKLLPNTELGHIYMTNNREAEIFASDATRQKLDLSWKEWALRFNEYLNYLESLFWPDLFIIGGGVGKNEKKYLPYFTVKSKVVTAQLLNNAGIIGAAMAAKKAFDTEPMLND
jgi:polyphosphate glucokinase